jgi:hypothetical protein
MTSLIDPKCKNGDARGYRQNHFSPLIKIIALVVTPKIFHPYINIMNNKFVILSAAHQMFMNLTI